MSYDPDSPMYPQQKPDIFTSQAHINPPPPTLRDLCDRAVEIESLYMELIMEVASVFPGETRHQTALKYIRKAEESAAIGPVMEDKA